MIMTKVSRMKVLSLAASVACVAGTGSATTVIPPSFDQLVNDAQIIFQGTVTGVRSEWTGEGAQRHIVSYITFKVDDTFKGNPGAQCTLRMLGGTVAGQTMEVSDAPKFKAGDRDVLFVENNGTQFVPLVGIMHGRFRIRRDANGRDMIHANDGTPVASTDQVGKGSVTAAAGQPMTLQQLKQAVQARAAQRIP
jgi:hypothetical protein